MAIVQKQVLTINDEHRKGDVFIGFYQLEICIDSERSIAFDKGETFIEPSTIISDRDKAFRKAQK